MTEQREPGKIQHLTNPPTEAGFSLPNIAARLFDTPLLIAPAKVNAIAWALRDRLDLQGLAEPDAGAMEAVGPGLIGTGTFDASRGYYVDRGVAVIPVRGTLVNRGAWIGSSSGLTSYEGISKQIDMVRHDERVQAVMLDINSYGGEASGVDDLGDEIRELDQAKPVYAMIDGHGTSAAYWIASSARKVWIAKTSHGGSIGVVLTHYDLSGAAEQAGVVVTHIHAGAQKVLGSPWRSLSDEDKAKLQASVDKLYSTFVTTIASNRGIDSEVVRNTEAAIFEGPEMVDLKLADGVTTGRRLLAAIQADFFSPAPYRVAGSVSGGSRATAQDGGNPMSDTNDKGGASKAAETTYTQTEVDQLLADASADQDKAVEQATTDGAKAERERISAILGSEEAKTRPALAHKLAFSDKGYSAEDAAEILQASAEEAASTNSDPLAAAMAGNSPNVSSDDGSADLEGEEAEEAALANSIINA